MDLKYFYFFYFYSILLCSRKRKKKKNACSRKQYWHCWGFSKEDSLFHFCSSSFYFVMNCLACRLTNLSGKHGNLICLQLHSREVRKQINLSGSQLREDCLAYGFPANQCLACQVDIKNTSLLIWEPPVQFASHPLLGETKLGDVSPGNHLVFCKSFDGITLASLNSTET